MQCKKCRIQVIPNPHCGSFVLPKFDLLPITTKEQLLALPHKANLLLMRGKDVYAGSFWKGLNSIDCGGPLSATSVSASEEIFESDITFKRGKLVYYKIGYRIYHLKV